MKEFFALAPAEQIARMHQLARSALSRWPGRYGEPELIKYRENAVYSVRDAGGARFALRIHRFAYHSDAALLSELQWMAALREAGLAVPAVIPARDGALMVKVRVPDVPEPLQVDMLGWLDGRPVGSVEAGIAGSPAEVAALYHQVGRLAAELHAHTASWERPAGFVRHAWSAEGILGSEPLWGDFRALPELAPHRALIDRACAHLERDLLEFGRSPDRFGLIHADFVPENLLWSDGRVMLIDFDDAGYGWHMFELATALYFHVGRPGFGIVRDALAAGYRSVRPLPDEQWRHLGLFLLLRSLTYLGWVQTRSETETARAMTPHFVGTTVGLAGAYLAGR
ncbi:hypothetical protein TSH100_17490 [Azospirillum sp. TSH100]|uniref:phosphotransferase enzyme family protein n=1 Tax=Azospirillum sp. TSH100 TaxID=652764 RepID=UPI000D621C81|nr:phosphotransferase [Azospirillum sp. TSH100]PWC84627.1 hypothetical protein TSH100_17490 [Azospirillum sp. TSH100]QCG91028.1 aminoglycoside phosphotransferase [Azospirillum sp. TSH100]